MDCSITFDMGSGMQGKRRSIVSQSTHKGHLRSLCEHISQYELSSTDYKCIWSCTGACL